MILGLLFWDWQIETQWNLVITIVMFTQSTGYSRCILAQYRMVVSIVWHRRVKIFVKLVWFERMLWYRYLHISSFNSLWPNDAIWRHRTWSTLAQVMTCCLMAPSHYLSQRWLIFSNVMTSYIHQRAVSQETPPPSIMMFLEIFLMILSTISQHWFR